MSEHVQAYHFVGSTLRDGRPVPPDGVWLVHDGPVVLCESGLHASRRPWHALVHAPGETLCLVEVADIVAEEEDKLVARRRRIVRRVDLTADLRAFARECACDVLHLWDGAPDIVRRYLETGDEALREVAREAAASAAWAAARVAVTAAAWDAASAAAEAAAWAAARGAARDAARDAARAAAWAAAWAAARVAASDAAWATASAASAAQGARFDALCRQRLGVEEVA